MKNHVNWRQLSIAVLASLALTTPAYAAQESHGSVIDLTGHKTVTKTDQEMGKIEIGTGRIPSPNSRPMGSRHRIRNPKRAQPIPKRLRTKMHPVTGKYAVTA